MSPGCRLRQGDDGQALRIIDAHVHTEFDGRIDPTSHLAKTREEFLRELEENHVVGAVAHTQANDVDYVDLRDHGVVDCAGLDARVDEARLEQGLAAKKYGCIKIYLGYVHQFAYDRAYEPAYRLAEKYGVPVVFHTGDTDSTKAKLRFADPLTVDDVATDHPNVIFVLAHAGNPWIESAAEVAYKNPNVYLDVSAFAVGDLRRMSPEQLDTYVVKPIAWIFGYIDNPEKLMFGTDWPLTEIGPYLAAVKRAVPKEHWQAVFHDNAARIFKIGR
jgi:uncharacterized protein